MSTATQKRSPSGTSPWENKQPSEQEYKQRIQDWLSDPGLDIQGRLLSGRSRPTPPRGVRQEGEADGLWVTVWRRVSDERAL
ncbi:hypothetical protein MRS44_014421 [Fusarium solani]|uniref:uncharacterized protein n=1 Tax=Fusarium solani TaxID=169388 RepID=UPI0032C43F84|nr:hypothetical protein MRS44_014421 [Fusarium solani]